MRRRSAWWLSLVMVLMTAFLWLGALPPLARAATAGSDRVTVDGRTAEVTPMDSTELRIVIDGEEWTYHRDFNKNSGVSTSSVSGPLNGKVDPMLVDRVAEKWLTLHPEWAYPRPPRSAWATIFGLAFIGLGLVELFNPRLAWYLSEGWKFRDAEPSDIALVMARLGGVVAAVAGIFLLLG